MPRGEIPPASFPKIDRLQILDERTRGNLPEEEKRLLDSLLMDLRLQYVRLAGPEA